MEAQDLPPVDAGMMAFYNRLCEASPAEAVTWPLDRQRAGWNAVCRQFASPVPPGIDVRDLQVPRADGGTVPVRLYRPRGRDRLAGVLYLHGGGWVLGGFDTHGDICADLADRSGTAVALVDYRLAPEHPHPAQFEDNLAVLAFLRSPEAADLGIDRDRTIAAGDSAGGQMSAALAMHLRDTGGRQLLGQVLIYPALGTDFTTASYRRNAHAPCLTLEEMQYFWEAELGQKGGQAWRDKRAVPLLETDYRGLPPAFVTAAAHDPLHDDALVYVERLRAAGIAAELRIEPALAHSYMRARHVSAPAAAGFAAIAEAIARMAASG